MATEEWIKRAIQNGKLYEDLPPRVRTVLPVSEWKLKYVASIQLCEHCQHETALPACQKLVEAELSPVECLKMALHPQGEGALHTERPAMG